MSKQLVVIGGGAAGFFCAVNAARMDPSLKVILIEKSNKLLSKVKVSGGGRCNVTHACFDIAEMSKQYPRGRHFVKKAFYQFFTADTIKWFEERGVKLKTEEDGRMFPVTDSSQTIIDCLLKEANKYHIEIFMNKEVKKVNVQYSMFNVQCSNGETLQPDYLCIASGGYPKPGMFDWLKELGHTIEEPVPSLFTFNLPKHPITKLMGVSVENASVKIVGAKLEEPGPLLITHWGLSGPAVLRLSAWAARELHAVGYQFVLRVNWRPALTRAALASEFQARRVSQGARQLVNTPLAPLSARLWEALVLASGLTRETRWAALSKAQQHRLLEQLTATDFTVTGKSLNKDEFVTCGGVRLDEVNFRTMESRLCPGLHFAGELLDIDGITGGFNFQSAWTTGWLAGSAIAEGEGR